MIIYLSIMQLFLQKKMLKTQKALTNLDIFSIHTLVTLEFGQNAPPVGQASNLVVAGILSKSVTSRYIGAAKLVNSA